MANRQSIHVDQDDFVICQLQILRVVVPVDHVVIVRNFVHHVQQFLSCCLRQIVLHEINPFEGSFLHVRQITFRNNSAVYLFQHVNILFHAPVHSLRLICQYLRERLGVEKLKYGTVTVADADNIVGNSRWDAENQSESRHFPLMLNLLQRVSVVVYLYDIVMINSVDRSVGTSSNNLAPLNGNCPVCPFNVHHLCEPGHVEYIVYLRTGVYDVYVFICFSQAQQNPQSGAGHVLQLRCVDKNRQFFSAVYNSLYFGVHFRSICGIDASG